MKVGRVRVDQKLVNSSARQKPALSALPLGNLVRSRVSRASTPDSDKSQAKTVWLRSTVARRVPHVEVERSQAVKGPFRHAQSHLASVTIGSRPQSSRGVRAHRPTLDVVATAQDQLRAAVREHVVPLLRAHGFKGTFPTWRRTGDRGDVAVVNIQFSSWNTRERAAFHVNLAVAADPWLDWEAVRFDRPRSKTVQETMASGGTDSIHLPTGDTTGKHTTKPQPRRPPSPSPSKSRTSDCPSSFR